MSATVPFQVGSWVTLKAASRRSCDQRDAKTPALITALSIEGSGAATVIFPNPLALRFGFQGDAWKRQQGVPLKRLKMHKGTAPLEAALLAALRSKRLGSTKEIPEVSTRKRALSPEPDTDYMATKMSQMSGLDRFLQPRAQNTEASQVPSPEQNELRKSPGLRQWMKPGSVWHADVDPLASVRAALQPFRKIPRASATTEVLTVVDEETITPRAKEAETDVEEKAIVETENVVMVTKEVSGQASTEVERAEKALEVAEALAVIEEDTVTPQQKESKTEAEVKAVAETEKSVLSIEEVSGHALTEMEHAEKALEVAEPEEVAEPKFLWDSPTSPEDGCSSPQSPFARRAACLSWTPSPQKVSAPRVTLERLEKFVKLVARTFAEKRSTQLPKMELYKSVNALEAFSMNFFEAQLQTMETQSKVAVIDDMIFSLCE
eukprot:TRINITY_DN13873_c0_g1_i1.p1 TRINITY_DN13873_c0_g1~~TRINITY_DN13873_c0_g1_i1.p1  ORF type:complete len:435 (-),score=119.19 TRINITY_DN13873_c0_g1_i1:45-1349(-)